MIIDKRDVGRYAFIFDLNEEKEHFHEFNGARYYEGDWKLVSVGHQITEQDIGLYAHLKPMWDWLADNTSVFQIHVVTMGGGGIGIVALKIEVEQRVAPLFRLFWSYDAF